MRKSHRVLPIVIAVAAAQLGNGCGSDSDNPTPTRKMYPKDDIDALKTNEVVILDALDEPVRVVRDKRGMVHVYARSLKDAATAQGFFIARDRAPQLELVRRVAEGRLAEYAGNLLRDLAAQDIFFRAIGLHRVAKKYYASLESGSDAKAIVDGYAAGVTAYFRQIRDGTAKGVPAGWLAIPRERYTDWNGADSLAIARLQTFALSYNANDKVGFTQLYDAIHKTFRGDSTDPALKARAGFPLDVVRFEPAMKVPVLDTGVPASALSADLGGRGSPSPPFASSPPFLSQQLLDEVLPVLRAGRRALDMFGTAGDVGSNNWVIGPSKSATGRTLVGSDPHLGLQAPAIFHMTALHVLSDDPRQKFDAAGMSFAGIPGIVLGFNKDVAWGATVAVFDVADVYKDVVQPGQAGKEGAVKIAGRDVPIEPITEMLDYGDGRPEPIVIETIPGHGVILPTVKDARFVPRTSANVLSYRWTGMEPTGEVAAFVGLARAKNVDDAQQAMQAFEVGSQNFVIGDSSGNILYTTHSLVPTRPRGALAWDAKKFTGQLPCMVLPGDAGLEWTGRVVDSLLPHAKNPSSGYVATANSDQYGLSFDNDPSNDPVYLGCEWDIGFREARIRDRIDALSRDRGLTLDALQSIQADARSPLGNRIAKHFVAAVRRAEDARFGVKAAPDLATALADPRYSGTRMQFVLSLFEEWKKLDYDTPAAVEVAGDPIPTPAQIIASQATTLFNVAMIPLLKRTFEDEWQALGKPWWTVDFRVKGLLRILDRPEPLATADATGESILWDDLGTKDVVESKDDRLVIALLDALEWLGKGLGDDPGGWRWGALHTLRFASLITGTGSQLSIPNDGDSRFPRGGFPRHGDQYVVDASQFGLGGDAYAFQFAYSSGPAQRFVASLASGAPEVRNALPGGNVWIPSSPHFDDEAALWRKNQTLPVHFTPAEVVADAEERVDLLPP